MSNQKCSDCSQEIPESSMAHSCPGPAKAEQANRRERFASTTFRALPHAQTPEGELEAKDAEIAALKSQNTQLGIGVQERMVEIDRLEAEIAALRAECAKLKQAGERAVGKLREHLTGKVSEPLEETITKLRDAAALTPSDAGKRYAAMARVCEILEDGYGHCPHCDGDHAPSEFDKKLHAALAALRELEK